MEKIIKVVNDDGDTFWLNADGECHSFDDKPSIVLANGDKGWMYEGTLHREGGKPAVILADGTEWFYWYGMAITEKQAKEIAKTRILD